MNWFARLCRNMGLMLHNVRHPDDEAGTGERRKKVVRRETEKDEKEGGVIVRRTTIEEIEFPAEDESSDRTG